MLGAPAGTSSQRAPRRLGRIEAKATRIRGLRWERPAARWWVGVCGWSGHERPIPGVTAAAFRSANATAAPAQPSNEAEHQ
jgi:hypothetical protein